MPIREVLADSTVKLERTVAEEILFQFVTLADDAKAIAYGDMYISDAAYSRMLTAMLQLAPGGGTVVGTVGKMYEDASKGYATAPEAVKEALTLERADMQPVQVDIIYTQR